MTGRSPRRAAVVVHHRTPAETVRCIAALKRAGLAPREIILVDNASEDGSAERVQRAEGGLHWVVSTVNRGFAGGANLGIAAAQRLGVERVLLVNSDAYVDMACVTQLEGAFESDPTLGIVGPVLVDDTEPGRIESAGLRFDTGSGRFRELACGQTATRRFGVRVVDGVSACVMLVRADVFERVGSFDEAFFFGFEDLDLCLRARAGGFGIACIEAARARHGRNATIGRRAAERLYYAVRNHLRVGSRAPGTALAGLRQVAIFGLNVAHVLRQRDVGRLSGLRATLRGGLDHWRGRYGAAPLLR